MPPLCREGAKITGVDDKTYSSTGEAFSTVLLPNSESHTEKKLQADDVSLAYECESSPSNGIVQPTSQPSMLTFLCM